MQKVLSITLILFLFFSSCKKDEAFEGTFELSGTVRDELTGNPIAFADVSIIEREKGWTAGYAGKLVGSQIANEKGEFVISFPANEKGYSYEIVATEYNKYFEDNSPSRVSLTQSGKGRQDITLMPIGYLTFIIKGNKGGWKLGGQFGTFYQGVDTIRTLYKKPNENTKFTYEERDKDNNIVGTKTNSIFIPLPPDTAFYLIEF